jgi:demethylmenaquinone methyltransferase/2-methoxy-6-polyprenyl-1,4-benzoquinol methylase
MRHDLVPVGSGAMFDAIAPRYDLLNRVLSLGIDQRWRRKTCDALGLGPKADVLDVATGTADLALMIAKRHGDAQVTGLDPSTNMLAIGRQKVTARTLDGRVTLVPGDAMELPFADGSFDGVCIAFGIRNVPDRPRALGEMTRVLRPGGKLAVLELSEPRGPLGPLARLHVHHVVPWIGGLLSGSREYRYLQKSIAAFPPPEVFAGLMRDAGLGAVAATPLTFGACHLYVGTRG